MPTPPLSVSFEEMLDVFDDRPLPGASFAESVIRFFRRYAVFSGRASRSEHWWAMLFQGLVGLLWSTLLLFAVAAGGTTGEAGSPTLGTASTWADVVIVVVLVLVGLYTLATVVPTVALRTRRLHDAGLSGWFQLLSLVPFVEYAVLVLLLLPSNPSGRRFDRTLPSDWDEPEIGAAARS